MNTYQLFHEIVGEENARVRLEIVKLGLKDRITFRNLHYPEHREAFADRGGTTTPALWDGLRLHDGERAIARVLHSLAAGRDV